MDLFVRETGPVGAAAIVFLHGGRRSGWSWEPVVERLPGFRCLVPDLPQFGRSIHQGPLEIGSAADAVAELIRTRVKSGRAHVVGFSLGAQVAVKLLAAEPGLVDRAVLCGTAINTLPSVRLTQLGVGLLVRVPWSRWLLTRQWNTHTLAVPSAWLDAYHEDSRLVTGKRVGQIVVASAGFTAPDGIDASEVPTLFVTGANEFPLARRWAATLARRMPKGVDTVAIGMRHDWPLRYPDLFARTVEGWLTETALPPEIALR